MRTLGRRHAASRGRVLIALGLGLAAAAAMAIPALLVARDETAAHAQLHVASAAIVMAVAAAVALIWRSPGAEASGSHGCLCSRRCPCSHSRS